MMLASMTVFARATLFFASVASTNPGLAPVSRIGFQAATATESRPLITTRLAVNPEKEVVFYFNAVVGLDRRT